MKTTMLCLWSALLVTGCVAPPSARESEVISLVKATTSWNGQPLPAYPVGEPEITILKITIPPGTALPMHLHPVINAAVLLRGQLTVTTEQGQVFHLQPSDAFVEVVDTWHSGKNEGSEPTELLVFYAGIKDEPITISQPADHSSSPQSAAGGHR